MENSMGVGLLAVCAVSGSVALIALQVQKRLLSDFMKKIESELQGLGTSQKYKTKKKVQFAEDVIEPSSNNREYRRSKCQAKTDQGFDMPANRQVLYKGLVQHRMHRGCSAL
ncbi:uncharacterized protein LOC115726670 [Rhodamnia argentea]|uniref:Uncharacterized protein LOC115726670 n=1 Tax=Rhodamnia argentea TaxID=178133 RepID=A0A8B8MRD9_9MYRT|nr:uncharacterized protein LOC115726670 [Rhodamnia argentea]